MATTSTRNDWSIQRPMKVQNSKPAKVSDEDAEATTRFWLGIFAYVVIALLIIMLSYFAKNSPPVEDGFFLP